MILDLSDDAQRIWPRGSEGLRSPPAAISWWHQAERQAGHRGAASLVMPVLEGLGVFGARTPRRCGRSSEAAAAVCRSAGYWALPYPVAERSGATRRDLDVDGLVVVAADAPDAALVAAGTTGGPLSHWTARAAR